jgi:energy-coupling factor transporter transmembrane protein EcfT
MMNVEMTMKQFDPRTKLALGMMAIAAVLIAREPSTLIVETVVVLISVPFMGMGKKIIRSFRLIWPMMVPVFIIGLLFFNLQVALLLTIRLFTLLTVSFVFFRAINPEETGFALRKIGIPFGFSFILTTGMRYVPLIGQKIRSISDAQRARGIDLRPRIKNIGNLIALLMPLLVQSFLLSDELALAMESRGFGCKGRSSLKNYRLTLKEYGLMIASLAFLVAFAWWERG